MIAPAPGGPADESVFVRGLPPGQHESLLYVWTSDADQKDADFLSVLDADPASSSYGKVIATAPTGRLGTKRTISATPPTPTGFSSVGCSRTDCSSTTSPPIPSTRSSSRRSPTSPRAPASRDPTPSMPCRVA